MQITNSYHQLGGDFYKEQQPDKVKNPQLIAFNQKLATELDIKRGEDEKYLVDIFSGNELLLNSKPISLAYAGHQLDWWRRPTLHHRRRSDVRFMALVGMGLCACHGRNDADCGIDV